MQKKERMKMSKNAERYKKYYRAGWYTKSMISKLFEKGAITEEEYQEIIDLDATGEAVNE